MERFVAIEEPSDLCSFSERRRLEIMKAEWFQFARREEAKKDIVCSMIEGTIKKNRKEVMVNKRCMMSELMQRKTQQQR